MDEETENHHGSIAPTTRCDRYGVMPSARNTKDTHYKQLNGLVKVLHTIEMISLAYSFSSDAFPQYPATHGAVPKYIRFKTRFEGIHRLEDLNISKDKAKRCRRVGPQSSLQPLCLDFRDIDIDAPVFDTEGQSFIQMVLERPKERRADTNGNNISSAQ
jgi:hypothetical protein